MEDYVQVAFSTAVNSAVVLAEMSGEEVRITFRSVTLVVTRGRSATEVMEEFDAARKLVQNVSNICGLFLSCFDASELRLFVRCNTGVLGFAEDSLPDPAATLKDVATRAAELVIETGAATRPELWQSLIAQRPRRKDQIEGVKNAINS